MVPLCAVLLDVVPVDVVPVDVVPNGESAWSSLIVLALAEEGVAWTGLCGGSGEVIKP